MRLTASDDELMVKLFQDSTQAFVSEHIIWDCWLAETAQRRLPC